MCVWIISCFLSRLSFYCVYVLFHIEICCFCIFFSTHSKRVDSINWLILFKFVWLYILFVLKYGCMLSFGSSLSLGSFDLMKIYILFTESVLKADSFLSRLWSMYSFHLWSHLYIYTKGCKMSVLSSFLIHDCIFSRSCYFDRVLKSILSCLYWYVVGWILLIHGFFVFCSRSIYT